MATACMTSHAAVLLIIISTVPIYAQLVPNSPSCTDVMGFTKINYTQNCTESVFGCNTTDTCTTRRKLPESIQLLVNLNISCVSDSMNVTLNENNTNCKHVIANASANTKGHFTVVLWVKILCDNSCHLFTYGDLAVEYVNSNALHINGSTTKGTLQPNWNFIALRYNGNISYFIGDVAQTPISRQVTSNSTLIIGPKRNLTAQENIHIGNVTWFSDVLTDREIQQLYSGKFQAAPIDSDCRCPAEYPTIIKETVPVQYIMCGDIYNKTYVARLNTYHNIIDKNLNTTWTLIQTKDITLTLQLPKVVQIVVLQINEVLSTQNISISICLLRVRTTTSNASVNNNTCVSDIISGSSSGKYFYLFEKNDTKFDILQIVADTVSIRLQAANEMNFTISELSLHARCFCYGNDPKCQINSTNGSYECTCPGYYQDEFKCQNRCGCSAIGTIDNSTCSQIDGNCSCKANFTGHLCDQCEAGFFNKSPTTIDCEDCECNWVGSISSTCSGATGLCKCRDQQTYTKNMKCKPIFLKLLPSYGPLAGGTLVTVSGLLFGTSDMVVDVQIGGISQRILAHNETAIVFKTIGRSDVGEQAVYINWTSSNKEMLINVTAYSFKPDPIINVPDYTIKSFASGGCSLPFTGTYLSSVPRPLLVVHLDSSTNLTTACSTQIHKGKEEMVCTTPRISSNLSYFALSYGFDMDNVSDYHNVSSNHVTTFLIVPDPKLESEKFSTFKNTLETIFVMMGQGLLDACQDSDVHVLIGNQECELVSRTNDSIRCKPNEKFPGTSRIVDVKIKIGNMECMWGKLQLLNFWDTKEFIYIAVGVGLFILILLAILIGCCCWRQRKKSTRNNAKSRDRVQLTNVDGSSLNIYKSFPSSPKSVDVKLNDDNVAPMAALNINPIDAFCDRLRSDVSGIVKAVLIDSSAVELGKLCTNKGKLIRVISGHFGANSPYPGTKLTIKNLINSYPEDGLLPTWLNDGIQESVRLREYTNEHILGLKGIAVDSKHVYMLYPEMERTLKDYLITSATKSPLSYCMKIEICAQLTEGMMFLCGRNVVHKDLAARNCWVSHDQIIKIADTSFSYDLNPEEYLEINGRYHPVRWMAPESLRQGFYDNKSDVWSFGVLMWEIFMDGLLPYPDVKNNQDVQHKVLEEGYRLEKNKCTEDIYSVIAQCQQEVSSQRPTCSWIDKELRKIISPDNGLVSYVNESFHHDQDELTDYCNKEIIEKFSKPLFETSSQV